MRKMSIVSMILALAVVLSGMTVPFAYAEDGDSVEIKAEKVYYFNGFSKPEDIGNMITSNLVEPMIITSDDGLGVLRLENTGATNSNASGLFYFNDKNSKDSYINTKNEKDVLVLEYKVRMADTCNSYDYVGPYAKHEYNAIVGGYKFKDKLRTDSNADGVQIAELDQDQWNTITAIYNNTDGSRKMYLNGEFIIELKEGVNGYISSKYYDSGCNQFKATMVAYMKNLGDWCEMDYIKIYNIANQLNVENIQTYENLDELYVDFDSTVFNFNIENFSLEDNSILDAELVDPGENIIKLTLENELDFQTDYQLNVAGVSNIIDVECNQDINFTTRGKLFKVNEFKLENMIGDSFEGYPTETAGSFNVDITNDFNDERNMHVYGVQYNNELYLDKENSVNGMVTTDGKSGYYYSDIVFVPGENDQFSAFAWAEKETPIPVSPIVNYTADGIEELEYGYFTVSESDKTPVIEAAINEEYTGINVTVNTGEADSRLVGLLAKYGDEVEYVANKKTEADGSVSFFVPLHEENVGYYSLVVGVEKGNTASTVEPIPFYSPSFIANQVNEKINSEEATASTVAEFIDLLGEYLGVDSSALNALDNKNVVYEKLLTLKVLEEGSAYASYTDMLEAMVTAVKMAKIYEGKDTAEILKSGVEFGISEKTLETFVNVLTTEGKKYVADKLKGVDYSIPADMKEDVEFYTVIGGVYKAAHYTNVDSIIKIYSDELGININTYKSLKKPSVVSNGVLGTEFESFEKLGNQINTLIANQKRAESNSGSSVSSGSGSGGGGGGGSRVPSSNKYPTVETKKEEVKEDKKSYSDVTAGDWFYNDVMWATEKGMFIGTSETTFTPAMNLTWEQIAIVLGRLGHNLENKNGSADILRGDFAEVLYNFLADKNVYGTKDEWIAASKVFIGDANGDMMFDKPLTRAECCTVLRRIESK